jgi:hypothetical protein
LGSKNCVKNATSNKKEAQNKNIHNTFKFNAMKTKNTRVVAIKD